MCCTIAVQQYDAGGINSGRAAFLPRDPVGRAARSAHAAGALAATQAGVDLIVKAGRFNIPYTTPR